MSSNSESEPRLVYSWRGFLLIAVLMAFGVVLAYFGWWLGNASLLIWGFLVLLSSTLALIPITARLAAYGALANRLREIELEEKIKERLKKTGESKESGEV